MYHLFDDDFIREMTENSIRREAREEGRAEAVADSITKLAHFFRETDPSLTEEAAAAKARAVLEGAGA